MFRHSPPHSAVGRGYSLALLSALVLSTTGIFIRYLTEAHKMPALLLAFWRDGIVALALLLALAAGFRRLLPVRRSQLPYLLFFGAMLAAFNALWTLSVALNGAAVSTVLVYSSTAFTALLGRWLLKEQPDRARALAILFCLVGCAMVSGALFPQAWLSNALGILVGVLSGLWYAIYTLLGRAAAQRGLNAWTTLLYTFGFAAGFLLLLNLAGSLLPAGLLPGSIAHPQDLLWAGGAAGWAILVALAVGPTLLGFGLYNLSLSHLPSNLVNLIVTSEPAFTAVIAYFVLAERLNSLQITGSAIILLSVLFLRIYEDRREKRARRLQTAGIEIPAGD